jgi:hypothetical protein
MQLKPNQLHIMTIHAQGNEIIGKGHKVFNDMLCVIKKTSKSLEIVRIL